MTEAAEDVKSEEIKATQPEGESQKAEEESSTSSNKPYVAKRQVGQNREFAEKRIADQRDKFKTATAELNGENNELSNEIMRLTNENNQLRNTFNPSEKQPSLAQFDNEEQFNAAVHDFHSKRNNALIDKRFNEHAANQTEINRQNSSSTAINSHYDRVQKMGNPDYDQAELNVINILGESIVSSICQKSDNSEQLLFMLGSDTDKAYKLRTLFDTDAERATMELGRLSAEAGSFKKENRPDPEPDLEGGTAPTVTHANLQKKYDIALNKAQETGETTGLKEIRKQARESGLTLK